MNNTSWQSKTNKCLTSILRKPSRISKAIMGRLPGIVHIGNRAVGKQSRTGETLEFTKYFKNSSESYEAYKRELEARQLFANKPWIAPIIRYRERQITLPFYRANSRLDHAALSIDKPMRFDVAYKAIKILFDIFYAGYAHGDFHTKNMFWIDEDLVLVDFEKLTKYIEPMRPAFPISYDLTGQGQLESPPFNSCKVPLMHYEAKTPSKKSLRLVLGIPLENVLNKMISDFMSRLREVSTTFRTSRNHRKRHSTKVQRIYSSFELPYMSVSAHETQRDSFRRLSKFGINKENIRGKTILDLGCNVGSMIFESQIYHPSKCLGVEYDKEKVLLTNQIAAYNGLNNVRFIQGDIDRLKKDDLKGPFDITYCLAVEAHVKEKLRLFRLLSEMTLETLYLEGNSTTDLNTVKLNLLKVGFSHVESRGLCDDDYLPQNNKRPLFVARK